MTEQIMRLAHQVDGALHLLDCGFVFAKPILDLADQRSGTAQPGQICAQSSGASSGEIQSLRKSPATQCHLCC
jgi:hypothetical protein